jgi:hypothetical protein
LMPEELKAWVDAKFAQEGQVFSDGTVSNSGAGTTGDVG